MDFFDQNRIFISLSGISMVPARFGTDRVLLGEVGWRPVFGDRLWALPVRIFVCNHRDKCPKGDVPVMPLEVAARWSEQGARCYLLHCCSTAGFDAVVTSPQWRSLWLKRQQQRSKALGLSQMACPAVFHGAGRESG